MFSAPAVRYEAKARWLQASYERPRKGGAPAFRLEFGAAQAWHSALIDLFEMPNSPNAMLLERSTACKAFGSSLNA